jgi:hypothetical protein
MGIRATKYFDKAGFCLMSRSDGNKRKKNRSGNANVIKIIVAIVLVLALAGYAVYSTGAIPRILNGVTVTKTMSDGSKKVVGKTSVLETNFHFSGIFNQYYYYGQVTKETLDNVKDETTGETWRIFLIDTTAEQIENQILILDQAKTNGFEELSQAKRCAELQSETLNSTAKTNGYPSVSAYLSAAYGTGMSLRLYKDYLAKEIMTEEYENYLTQFEMIPSNEDVKKANEENPDQYQMADFDFYFFSAETDENGKAKNLDEVEKQAQKVADVAKDPTTFMQAVISVLKDRGEDSYAEALKSGEDTTHHDGMTSSYLSSLNAQITEYLFKAENIGKATVIKTDTGAYAVYLDKLYQDMTPTVSYRTLTLNVNTKDNASEEDISKAVADTEAKANTLLGTTRLTNLDFYKLVKANSDVTDEILDGGFVANGVLKDFIPEENAEAEDGEDAESSEKSKDLAKEAAGTWLFDSARQEGDTYVSVSDDKKTVTIYFFIDNIPGWAYSARSSLATDTYNKWKKDLQETDTPNYVINAGWVKNFAY